MLAAMLRDGQARRRGEARAMAEIPAVDPWIPYAALLLAAIGVVMVASASMPLAAEQGDAFRYLTSQLRHLALGLACAAGMLLVPLELWRRLGPLVLLVALGLLVAVLIPGLGREVNGATRWLEVGPAAVQVSEPVKLLLVVYLARYLTRREPASGMTLGALAPLVAMLAIVAALLLAEPDFGAVAVVAVVALGMVFLAGVAAWRVLALGAGALALLAAAIYSAPYRLERLQSFRHPWEDPFDSGFQLTQALIAVGRGELFGVGVGASVQKLFYLPEAHTDFLFAILAEELGLAGVAAVIALFVVIVWRAFRIGAAAERAGLAYGGLLAQGLGLLVGVQALTNIGVNLGALPTKGLTLPLMSYGGSSMVAVCAALGLLLRVDAEARFLGAGADPGPNRAQREGTA